MSVSNSLDATNDLTHSFYPCKHISVPLLSPTECEQVRSLCKNLSPSRGTIDITAGSLTLRRLIRNAQIAWLEQRADTNWLFTRVVAAVAAINYRHLKYSISRFENLQYNIYGVGGHYAWHTDVGPGNNLTRKLSFSVQLSTDDSYVGGALQFHGGRQKPIADKSLGSMTVFPSFMLHRVKPVLFGTRTALVGWAHGDEPLK